MTNDLKITEHEAIRRAGGIVHGDGNIFFTSVEVFNKARALLAAENQASATADRQAGWQPIATAPQDDTPVDIWVPCKYIAGDGERHTHMFREDLGNGNVFYSPLKDGESWVIDATHFMIVLPPTAQTEGV